MESWAIRPFDAVGPLTFGMPRASVREMLGGAFRTFRKSRSSESETDAYDGPGLHLYYDAKDELKFIERTPPCALIWGSSVVLPQRSANHLGENARVGPAGRFRLLGMSF